MARRKRCCRPRGAGRRGEHTIDFRDHVRLQRDLVHDPKAVLVFFALAGIAFLCDLDCWEALKVACPDDIARIVATAALFGIPEKPQAVLPPKGVFAV